jgi:hypothetical protein
MRGRFAGLAMVILAGCGAPVGDVLEPDPPGTEYVSFLGVTYPVLRVAAEPTPDLSGDLILLPDGGRAVPPGAPFVTTGPAIRVGNAAARQTATDVVATYCARRGMAVAPGWRDVVVRFDDTTADHVFYMDC